MQVIVNSADSRSQEIHLPEVLAIGARTGEQIVILFVNLVKKETSDPVIGIDEFSRNKVDCRWGFQFEFHHPGVHSALTDHSLRQEGGGKQRYPSCLL